MRCSPSASDAASVMVPTRPMYISRISISWAESGRSAVMPVDRPTVAKAEITSKMTRSVAISVVCRMNTVPSTTTALLRTSTVMAWRWAEWLMRRPKASVSIRPRISAMTSITRIIAVPTFTPPAVPALPPPMNIRK